MAKTGFFFFHGDYYKDTRQLSLAARGGWVDLFGPLYEAGGTIDWPISGYARFWGVDNDQAMEVLMELQRYNVAEVEFHEDTELPKKMANIANEWQSDGNANFAKKNGKKVLPLAKLSKALAKVSCRKILREVEKDKHKSEVRSDAGKKGAEKRWQNDGKNGTLLNLNLNPSLNNKEKLLDNKIQERVSAIRLDPKKWDQFVSFRQEIRKPLTKHAIDLAISKLKKLKDAGNDPSAVIEQSILNGWSGLFAVKRDRKGLPDGTDGKFVG